VAKGSGATSSEARFHSYTDISILIVEAHHAGPDQLRGAKRCRPVRMSRPQSNIRSERHDCFSKPTRSPARKGKDGPSLRLNRNETPHLPINPKLNYILSRLYTQGWLAAQ
jgi:hypothetical protein